MNKFKIGMTLIIVGNILYLVHTFFGNNNSNFGDFVGGLLLGLSIGINLIGIILVSKYGNYK